METIDLTPNHNRWIKLSWEAVLPMLLAALLDGNADGRKLATIELNNMAKVADAQVTLKDRVKQFVNSSNFNIITAAGDSSHTAKDSAAYFNGQLRAYENIYSLINTGKETDHD